MAVPGVPQSLDQISEVVVLSKQPWSREDLDVGLLDQILGQLTGPGHRAGRAEQRIDVIAGALRIESPNLALEEQGGQNGTAPSPFQEATSRRSFALTPFPESTHVRPPRSQVTIARPSSVTGAQADSVLDLLPRTGGRADRLPGEDRVADPLSVPRVVDGPGAAPVELVRALPGLFPDEVGMQIGERDAVDRGGEQLPVRLVNRDRCPRRGQVREPGGLDDGRAAGAGPEGEHHRERDCRSGTGQRGRPRPAAAAAEPGCCDASLRAPASGSPGPRCPGRAARPRLSAGDRGPRAASPSRRALPRARRGGSCRASHPRAAPGLAWFARRCGSFLGRDPCVLHPQRRTRGGSIPRKDPRNKYGPDPSLGLQPTQGVRNATHQQAGPAAHPGAGRGIRRPLRGDGRIRLRGGEDEAEQRQEQEHQDRRRSPPTRSPTAQSPLRSWRPTRWRRTRRMPRTR